jgi:hypothetical protein
MYDRRIIGSMTAKGGFANEKTISAKFRNWKNDDDAKRWLRIMGYDPSKISKIEAINIPPRISREFAAQLGISEAKYDEEIKYKKADIQIRLMIVMNGTLFVENISLKKANKSAGYNQVDKRPVDAYKLMWKFDEEIAKWLKLFTGEYNPSDYKAEIDYESLSDKRRVSFKEMPNEARDKIIKFFSENKTVVICDILKGRGGLSADWFLVTEKDGAKIYWVLRDINYVLNHYAQGNVEVSKKGSLKIGRVTMQRKGGTPDPTSLQFKINPLSLFEE